MQPLVFFLEESPTIVMQLLQSDGACLWLAHRFAKRGTQIDVQMGYDAPALSRCCSYTHFFHCCSQRVIRQSRFNSSMKQDSGVGRMFAHMYQNGVGAMVGATNKDTTTLPT